MNTKVVRIDLTKADKDLEKKLETLCDNQAFGGFRLAASFVFGTDLLLIFQSSHDQVQPAK
jgi:hypothetical protein